MSRAGLDGKVFIITGSTQGLGEAVAIALAKKKAKGLVICGRSEARGARVKALLEEEGCPTELVIADLEKERDCRAIVARADARFGRVDGLVNAAGLTNRGTLDDTTVELWDLLFAVNVRAPFILCQETARIMKREGAGGSIVNIASMSAHGGQPFLTPYCTSKGALVTFSKNIANALVRDRIRVNVVNLGWTDTPGEHAIQKATGGAPDWLERAEAAQPFGRLIKPRDVASMATFLLSDDAEMVTGAVIDLDQNVMGTYD